VRTIQVVAIVLVGLLAGCAKRLVPVYEPGAAPIVESPAERDVSLRPGERVLTHTVREGETLRRLADLYYGDPDRARSIARDNTISETARLAPGSILRLQFEPGEFDRAQRRAAALEPYNRGVVALERSDLDEAERQFRLALRAVPDLPDAQYNLALVLLKRGQAEVAADLLEDLVRKRPDEADFGFALGNALFQQTRYLEAAAAFGQVLALDPTHRRAAFGHARALQEAGRRPEAVQAWRRYLELDPSSTWAGEARRHLRELQGG